MIVKESFQGSRLRGRNTEVPVKEALDADLILLRLRLHGSEPRVEILGGKRVQTRNRLKENGRQCRMVS